MLTSLLSAYIASSIKPELNVNDQVPTENTITNGFYLDSIEKQLEAPIKDADKIAPVIEAKGSIAIDRKTGTTLYEKNAHSRMPIASITKLMTALIIIEENKLEEIVTVSAKANSTGGSTMHLRTGEKITVENLLKGIMLNSGNDAAIALAEHNAGSVPAFIEKMNKRAIELGLINTHFSNPTGLDHPDNYSSAHDIAKLGNFIYNNKFIQDIAQTKTTDVYSIDGQYKHTLTSTNELLDSYLKIKGLKTGRTDAAGLCLITVAENDQGHEVVTVVLNSPARFQESKVLIDWIYRSYNW